MKTRPLSVVIIALIYFLEPVGNLFQAAFVNQMTLFGRSGLLSRLLWTDWLILALFPVVAVGIYRMRKWGWYLFIGFSCLLILYNLYVYPLNPNYAPETILLFIVIIAATSALFLQKHVYAPYFNPRLRWWETAARYRIVLDTSIVTEGAAEPCRTIDISETGCFLESRLLLAEGAAVWLKIRCRAAEIHCLGKVVRKSATRDALKGYGIMFQGMSRQASATLRDLVFALERLGREQRKDPIALSEVPLDFSRRGCTLLRQWLFRFRFFLTRALTYRRAGHRAP